MEVETGAQSPVVLYGRHPVLEALRMRPREIEELLVLHDGRGRGGDVVSLARQAGVRCSRASRAALTATAGTPHHQGLVARVAARPYASLDEILAAARTVGAPGLVLVLDQVQDPGNVGNLLRTAEAFGVQGAVLVRHEAAGLTAHVAKVAAGALEHLPVARVGNLVQAILALKDAGFWVVGGVAGGPGALPPWAVDLASPVALVLGSEGRGLRPLVARHCDLLVRIPLSGRIEALNVVAAGAALLYEAQRQRACGPQGRGLRREKTS